MNVPYRLCLTLICFVCCAAVYAQGEPGTPVLSPKQPEKQETIQITYDLRKTLLDTASVYCIAYLNEGADVPRAAEIALQKSGGILRGAIQTKPETRSIVVVFLDSLNQADNNDGQGYWLMIHAENKPVREAAASIAQMYAGGWNPKTFYHLEAKPEIAKRLYEQEFRDYPESKRKFTRYYLGTFDLRNTRQRAHFTAELDRYAALPDLSEWELLLAVSKYYQHIGARESADSYKREVFSRYPAGSWSIQSKSLPLVKAIYLATDSVERRAIYDRFKKEFTNEYPDEFTRRVMTNRQVQMLGKILELEQGNTPTEYWLSEIASFEVEFQRYAYHNTARAIFQHTQNIQLAAYLARKAAELQAEFLNAPRVDVEHPFMTDREVQTYRKTVMGKYLGLWGQILAKQQKLDEALPILKEAAVKWCNRKDAELNQAYIACLLGLQQTDDCIRELESIMEWGNSNEQISELYRSLIKDPQKANQARQLASDRLNRKVRSQMLAEPLPAGITFSDQFGNDLSLADYAGKTVVIDCWATWCAPCIAGLPAVEHLAERYKNDDVVFLFLHTRDANGKAKAAEMFAKRNSSLQLVFDTSNAASALNVPGLPTKIILDKDQMIRFRHVGLQGGFEEQVAELNTMLNLIRP